MEFFRIAGVAQPESKGQGAGTGASCLYAAGHCRHRLPRRLEL